MPALAIIQPDPPTPEEITARAVTAAVQAAFGHRGDPTLKQAIDVTAALVAFLSAADASGLPRSLSEWREAIENLEVSLGRA